ncbi:hypothetical protein ES705_51120 [subsurface metagenome]
MIGKKTTMELRRKAESDDEMGGRILTWAGLRNITGVLSTIRGNERLSADKLTVIADYYWYIDYPIGETITEEDIFQHGTRKFKVIYINDMGANMHHRYKITLKEET